MPEEQRLMEELGAIQSRLANYVESSQLMPGSRHPTCSPHTLREGIEY